MITDVCFFFPEYQRSTSLIDKSKVLGNHFGRAYGWHIWGDWFKGQLTPWIPWIGVKWMKWTQKKQEKPLENTGKNTKNYGQSAFLVGKSTINRPFPSISHSRVALLPRGPTGEADSFGTKLLGLEPFWWGWSTPPFWCLNTSTK